MRYTAPPQPRSSHSRQLNSERSAGQSSFSSGDSHTFIQSDPQTSPARGPPSSARFSNNAASSVRTFIDSNPQTSPARGPPSSPSVARGLQSPAGTEGGSMGGGSGELTVANITTGMSVLGQTLSAGRTAQDNRGARSQSRRRSAERPAWSRDTSRERSD